MQPELFLSSKQELFWLYGQRFASKLVIHPECHEDERESMMEAGLLFVKIVDIIFHCWCQFRVSTLIRKRRSNSNNTMVYRWCLTSPFPFLLSHPFSNRSSIFEGVTIYVNGLTSLSKIGILAQNSNTDFNFENMGSTLIISGPTADELKDIILQHGGNYTLYNSKSKVTHIVTENLCQAKINDIVFACWHISLSYCLLWTYL